MAKRVVLAYSGGLDTSVAVRWMIEKLGVEVIAVAVDVGQERRLGGAPGPGARPPAPSRPSWSTAGRSSPATSWRPALQGQRALRGPLPAGVGAVAAGDRASTSSRPPATTAPTRSPTAAPARATTRSASRSPPAPSPPTSRSSPRCDWGMTREDVDPLRLRATTSRSRRPRRSCTRSTTTSGAGPSSAARWRTRGPSRPPGVWSLTTADRHRAPRARRSASSRACPSRSTARRWRCTSSSPS